MIIASALAFAALGIAAPMASAAVQPSQAVAENLPSSGLMDDDDGVTGGHHGRGEGLDVEAEVEDGDDLAEVEVENDGSDLADIEIL